MLPVIASTFSLPFTDPVLIVALAMTIFLVVPLLFERMRIPGIIGLIVVGAAIGPNGLGLLARDETIVLLGTVGLLYLMFMVGLELDLHEFNRYRNRSIGFGTLSFAIPAAVGVTMGLVLGYSLLSALLLGSAFASHTLLAYPIASRLGIVRNEAVTATLGGTILTEILALLLLAGVANAAGGSLGAGFLFRLLLPFAVYVGVVLWGVPRLGRWFFRNAGNEAGTEFVFVMATLFTIAYLAHAAGVEPIVGALLAGLALNRLIPEQGLLMRRIHFAGNALFIPFFLLSVGMLVNVRALDTPRAWGIALALSLGVILSKWLAAKVAEKAFGYTSEEGWTVFGLSVPHAAGTLAIVLVGYEVGLLDQTEVNGVVLVILVSCLLGPWAVERYGRQVALREERRPYNPSEAPRRVLIPLANPATAETLLDLAFIVRGTGNPEPVHPLMVVPDYGEQTEAEVAEAERTLAHAVLYAASAEVPVVPLTRVDRNVASGIARGIAETRSSTVVVGWDGRRSAAREIFGTVLDRVLEETRQMVLVARLGHPLGTTTRVVLVLPPAVEHHPGFLEGIRTVKTITAGVGAPLVALPIQGEPQHLQEVYAAAGGPSVPASWEVLRGWGALRPELEGRLRREDLVVVVSARRGTLPWHPRLERLPSWLAELVPQSFILLYPPEVEPGSDRTTSPGALAPTRVVELGRVPLEAALRRLLESAFANPRRVREILGTLSEEGRELAEVIPGVIVPHTRIKGLREPILLLGVSREGVDLPDRRPPAHMVFLLISALERPEEHLRMLAEIARLVSRPQRVGEMLARHAPETPLEWLRVDNS
jgi:Kef-type K+ transport system membrane component KefB/mannitol/fructose-specific phosphotransferase system IIA component (Ntr-type)/nucleotide-binding universal stress UspA family protein